MTTSNEPSAASTSRHPFSLRELFCLTTLAGLLLALTLSAGWTSHERWLLGLTLGSTFLGVALARACKRRGWLIGILAGTIGGLIAVGIMGRDWLAELNLRIARGGWTAADLAEFRNDYLAAGAVTVGLGLLLALLGVACYLLLVWATDASEQGLVRKSRRHPYRAIAVATVIGALVLSVANLDFLLAPQSWAPRDFIRLKLMERPVFFSHGVMNVRTGSLSSQGDWLLVDTYTTGLSFPNNEYEMYRLDSRPQVVPFLVSPEKSSSVTFDGTGNRIAFLEWGMFYKDGPPDLPQLRIVDLDRHTSETLAEQPRESDIYGLQWLPDGSLVIHYGDDWNGKEGHTRLTRGEGRRWVRHDSDVVTEFNFLAGKALEFGPHGLRIVDIASSREVDSFSPKWVEEITEGTGRDPSAYFDLSPDGRFIMTGGKIYDREAKTTRHWQSANGFPQPHFHGFTPRGHALLDGQPKFVAWHPYFSLTDVPFGQLLINWLTREPIRLIDPATGLEVARTRPLPSSPDTITISHDGTRMAAFTDEGVYVYDVPEGFR